MSTTQNQPFRLEKQMTAPVEDWLRQRAPWVRREFFAGNAYCDLVGADIDPYCVQLRKARRHLSPLGPLHRVSLLMVIPDSPEGIDLGWIRGDTLCASDLEILRRRRMVKQLDNGRWRRTVDWLPMHHRVVAVELKLSKVPDVFYQCVGNRSFADESWAALPLDVARSVVQSRRVKPFREEGVGILAVSPEQCAVALNPGASRHEFFAESENVHAAERIWQYYRT